jgi:ribose 5-phosphate isomerase A
MNQDALKRAAAEAALSTLHPGEIVGVGTGSTVNHFIDLLAGIRDRVPAAVSSSQASTDRLLAHGIRVLDLNEVIAAGRSIPVYVDGADEIDASLAMIKGGGGALTREKILAAAAASFVCIVDRSKCVERLGRFPLPIEVVPMARELVASSIRAIGGEPRLREGFVTDNGNQILDVSGLAIDDPVGLERSINQWPGVVTVGLFAARGADIALVASPDGIERRTRAAG